MSLCAKVATLLFCAERPQTFEPSGAFCFSWGLEVMHMPPTKRRGGKRWLDIRARAFRRDRAAGAVCWICGQPIDYSLGISTCADAWEADHYLDVSRHPELEYDLGNIKASHMHCNRSRQTRAAINTLGNPSRDWRRGNR